MNPEVLILTSIYDFSADLVSLQLTEKNVSFLRINKEQISDYEFAIDPCQPLIKFSINGDDLGSSENLKSIWFRQPVFLRNTPPAPLSTDEQLERSQWSAFLRGLSVLDHVAWMNWPQATYLAESKPYQLLAAKRSGFDVPETLVSNSATAIKSTFHGEMIIKSLDTVLLRENDDTLFTYTTHCNKSDLSSDTLKTAPVLAQEYINPKIDYRVTVIGGDVFAVKILSEGKPIQGDWRIVEKQNLEYIDCGLPESTKDSCLRMMRGLNLSFGAIDLVETNGRLVFLEINPTGEWGWLNSDDRPLDATIARWLSERIAKHENF